MLRNIEILAKFKIVWLYKLFNSFLAPSMHVVTPAPLCTLALALHCTVPSGRSLADKLPSPPPPQPERTFPLIRCCTPSWWQVWELACKTAVALAGTLLSRRPRGQQVWQLTQFSRSEFLRVITNFSPLKRVFIRFDCIPKDVSQQKVLTMPWESKRMSSEGLERNSFSPAF